VFHGLSIYNFLKGAPIEVTTYNFGSVDSIGVIIFCSGDTRVCVPHARFLIHGVALTFGAKERCDEKDLEEKIKGLQIEYQNIARVISANTGKDVGKIVADMETRITLNPEEGKDYGLVTEIRSDLFPAGADLTVINEDVSVGQPVPIPIQPGLPIRIQHSTEPNTSSVSEPVTENNTTPNAEQDGAQQPAARFDFDSWGLDHGSL